MKKLKLEEDYLGGHKDVTHIDEGVLDYLIQKFNIKSMLDIGCGPGGMIDLANKKGLSVMGIDGDYTIYNKDILIHDYTKEKVLPLNQYDLIWSVEFVEHVEKKYMDNYLHSFQVGKVIVMTHAVPGQNGHHHVNCQSSEYWIKVFEDIGFKYSAEETMNIKKHSTMNYDFMKKSGKVFLDVNFNLNGV